MDRSYSGIALRERRPEDGPGCNPREAAPPRARPVSRGETRRIGPPGLTLRSCMGPVIYRLFMTIPALPRCGWAPSDPLYIAYHDEEWGRPVHDDRHLFEMLILEGAQAGLSWITILRKARRASKSIRQVRRQEDCRLQGAEVARAHE